MSEKKAHASVVKGVRTMKLHRTILAAWLRGETRCICSTTCPADLEVIGIRPPDRSDPDKLVLLIASSAFDQRPGAPEVQFDYQAGVVRLRFEESPIITPERRIEVN